MTPVKVVDASALGAVLFNESQRKAVQERLINSRMAAPRLLKVEIASVGRKKHRDGHLTVTQVQQALDDFSLWNVQWFDLPATKAFEAATESGLSAYDATYWWLARELNAELVTLDEGLEAMLKP